MSGIVKHRLSSPAERMMERKKAKRLLEKRIAAGEVSVEHMHPSRYPTHADPAKGQIWRGECNRTACERMEAVFFNTMTYGLYCSSCAHGIDCGNPVSICFRVNDKPTIEKMDHLHNEIGRRLNAARGAF